MSLGNSGTVADFIASLQGPVGPAGTSGTSGGTIVTQFPVPAHTTAVVNMPQTVSVAGFGNVTWTVESLSTSGNAGMTVRYSFPGTVNQDVLAALIQTMNQTGNGVNLSSTITMNVSNNEFTVSFVRTDDAAAWAEGLSILVTLLH